jgi:hypothetical protein
VGGRRGFGSEFENNFVSRGQEKALFGFLVAACIKQIFFYWRLHHSCGKIYICGDQALVTGTLIALLLLGSNLLFSFTGGGRRSEIII